MRRVMSCEYCHRRPGQTWATTEGKQACATCYEVREATAALEQALRQRGELPRCARGEQ